MGRNKKGKRKKGEIERQMISLTNIFHSIEIGILFNSAEMH